MESGIPLKSRLLRYFAAAAAVLLFASTSAAALKLDPRAVRGLRKLDANMRLEQVCDMEAMARITRDHKFLPDRAKSNIFSRPVHHGDTMIADGAAFRSRDKWYRFSFTCTGTPDHLNIVSFSYKLGSEIPKSRWADLALWGE
jgi:hypothetical protein